MKRGFSVAFSGFALAASFAPFSSVTANATPASSASATAPSASASATASQPASSTIAAYAWPTDVSRQPKDEDWGQGTELETVKVKRNGRMKDAVCEQRALREWVRITCKPPSSEHFGVVWGVAGDFKGTRAWFTPAGDLDFAKSPPADTFEATTRGMGADATVVLAPKAGSSLVVSLDEVRWDEGGYDEKFFAVGRGIVIDVTWAVGEKYPTIAYE